jgi:hypothetical protein
MSIYKFRLGEKKRGEKKGTGYFSAHLNLFLFAGAYILEGYYDLCS